MIWILLFTLFLEGIWFLGVCLQICRDRYVAEVPLYPMFCDPLVIDADVD